MRPKRLAWMLIATLFTGVLSGCSANYGQHENDPLEPINRKIFWFNNQLDNYALEPAAKGWNYVVPQVGQRALSRFFANLRFPVVTVNNLLQGKLKRTGTSLARFGINTTVGVLGFMDPAADWGLKPYPEDFGQTLGWWGVGPGPYLMLPFFGPSDPRDAVGLGVDYAASVYPFFVTTLTDSIIVSSGNAVNLVNARSRVLKDVENAKAAALDYYVFVRNAYLQHREALVKDTLSEESTVAGPNEGLYQVPSNQNDLYQVPNDDGQ
jgi:phospholipid-binding lipoprotein MlaA